MHTLSTQPGVHFLLEICTNMLRFVRLLIRFQAARFCAIAAQEKESMGAPPIASSVDAASSGIDGLASGRGVGARVALGVSNSRCSSHGPRTVKTGVSSSGSCAGGSGGGSADVFTGLYWLEPGPQSARVVVEVHVGHALLRLVLLPSSQRGGGAFNRCFF